MFSWPLFAKVALASNSELIAVDSRLAAMLLFNAPGAEQVDEVGRPLPNSVLIREHPDVFNFRRVIDIRLELARNNSDDNYVAYAEGVKEFLNSERGSADLYVILIATDMHVYEILYFSNCDSVLISIVDCP